MHAHVNLQQSSRSVPGAVAVRIEDVVLVATTAPILADAGFFGTVHEHRVPETADALARESPPQR
jgi:hypothetical protein